MKPKPNNPYKFNTSNGSAAVAIKAKADLTNAMPTHSWWLRQDGETLEQYRRRFSAQVAANQLRMSSSRFGLISSPTLGHNEAPSAMAAFRARNAASREL